jgi:hypothetical protein
VQQNKADEVIALRSSSKRIFRPVSLCPIHTTFGFYIHQLWLDFTDNLCLICVARLQVISCGAPKSLSNTNFFPKQSHVLSFFSTLNRKCEVKVKR